MNIMGKSFQKLTEEYKFKQTQDSEQSEANDSSPLEWAETNIIFEGQEIRVVFPMWEI